MTGQLTLAEQEELLKLARASGIKRKWTDLPPITRAERTGGVPLSFAQQRLWFLAQMEEAGAAYSIALGLRLQGKLNRSALRGALDRILLRHEILRTTFILRDEQPLQRIAAGEDIRFHLLEYDLRQHPSREAELQRLVEEESAAAFDLGTGPLIRGRLIQLEEEEHALLITMHHIVSDGWSVGVLMKELNALYGAYVRGEEDPLAPLSIQYGDYAVWQRWWMEGEKLREQGEYWKKQLGGAPELLALPLDRARPAQQDYAGGAVELVLEEELASGLRELSQRQGTTLYMTLLAAWAMLLGRLSGQEEVVIGTPVANRGRAEIEGLIGFFVNTLALRVDVSGSPRVSELLERVKQTALEAQQHQDIPFEQVVELLQPVRSLAHNPLFQELFTWQSEGEGRPELSGLQLRPLEHEFARRAKIDLTLALQEYGDRIVGEAVYATALFESETVKRYLGYFRRLLAGMVVDATQTVDRLPMLSAEERGQLLYGWNETEAKFPEQSCVHELFEQQARSRPEATAVVLGKNRLSYGELNRRANRLAHYLRELGVRPDARVAICVERGFQMMEAVLAVLKAGGAYVPLDPGYPAERLRYMLEDSQPQLVLTQRHLRELVAGLISGVSIIDLENDINWRNQPEMNPDRAAVVLEPGHLAYMIYTSGSAGHPKGVMVEHRSLCNLLIRHVSDLAVNSSTRISQFVSFSFDAWDEEALTALSGGGSLYVVQSSGVLQVEALTKVIEEYSITHVFLPPTILAALEYQTGWKSVTTIVVGGSRLTRETARRWGQGRRLINEYGPTEATVCATIHECRGDEECDPPIGRPMGNMRIYILDRHLQAVPVGVVGEIYIGGTGVARGYWKSPGLTGDKFLPDVYSRETGARMYRTGDLGRWLADGNIDFVGRNDSQVKVRGFRIEPGEIEALLLEHPGVREAAVIAREDTPGEKRLVAYYAVVETHALLGSEELRGHIAARLPEYMVPAAYVRVEALPLTHNGKLDRDALPAPDVDSYAVRGYEAPQGETEVKLSRVWSGLFGLERIGRHDNFFELGGHSLLLLKLVNLLEQAGMKVSPQEIFRCQTICDLAVKINNQATSSADDEAVLIRLSREPYLFVTHEGTGSVYYARLLAAQLWEHLSVWSLPPKSTDDEPLGSIVEMAARMVRMIRAVQPCGPYYVTGWSSGGILAYEIASQLVSVNQEVAFVGLLDTSYLPGLKTDPGSPAPEFDDKIQLLRFIEAKARKDRGLYREFEALKSKSHMMSFETLVESCHKTTLMPTQLSGATAGQVRRYLFSMHVSAWAYSEYVARPLPIPVHLFRAQVKDSLDPFLGWDAVVPDHLLKVVPIPGDHFSMMEDPHIEPLGHAISHAIRSALVTAGD